MDQEQAQQEMIKSFPDNIEFTHWNKDTEWKTLIPFSSLDVQIVHLPKFTTNT